MPIRGARGTARALLRALRVAKEHGERRVCVVVGRAQRILDSRAREAHTRQIRDELRIWFHGAAVGIASTTRRSSCALRVRDDRRGYGAPTPRLGRA